MSQVYEDDYGNELTAEQFAEFQAEQQEYERAKREAKQEYDIAKRYGMSFNEYYGKSAQQGE